MALDMLKRSLQLLRTSTVNAGKDYFSDVNTFVSDSKAIGAEMKDVVSKPFDFVRKMTTSGGGGGLFKFVNDWFYQRTSEFDDGDDDFDSGMPTESHGSGTADTESTNLDTKAMKGIAHQQIGAMYQIGQKQVQANLASTAEIVTNNNARSSEIITAINNLNKSVLSISESLKAIVSNSAQESRYQRTDATNIFNGSNLTLGAVYEAAKTAGGENPFLMRAKDIFTDLKQGPSAISDLIVKSVFDKIKIDDKSLQEHAENLNTKFSNSLDSILSRLMQTSGFKFIFGDDFTKLNTNIRSKDDYTRDKAVFDMMTRKSIVDIIPEYLKKITLALTGETWSINQRGKLTTDKIDVVGEHMSSVLQRSAFGYGASRKLTGADNHLQSNGKNVPPMVIDQILTWISMGYTVSMLEWASYFSTKENGMNQSPAAMLDKNSEIRANALSFAWGEFKKKYPGGCAGVINTYEDFVKVFDEIIGRILFDDATKKEFANAVKSNTHSALNMGVQLGELGHEVGTLNSQTISKYASTGMRAYDPNLEAAQLNAQNKFEEARAKAEERTEKEYEQYLISELKKYQLNPDDFKNVKGKLIPSKAIAALSKAIEENAEEEYFKANPDKAKDPASVLEAQNSFYSDGKKHNIGSLVYDIKKILENGINVTIVGFNHKKPPSAPGMESIGGTGGIPSRLNLNTNGCGPIALTDLANRMAMNGTYDPYNGTTVGGFINQANQLGMNIRPGRVTQQSLRNASPNNPITVMGSGYGFGTIPGQNHYMNITGYGDGYVYTYNPMYGNGLYPIGAISNNSILGLFGGKGQGSTEETENIAKAAAEAQGLVSEAAEGLNHALEGIEPTSILGKALTALGVRTKVTKAGNKINEKIGSAEEKATSGGSKWSRVKGSIGNYFSYKKQMISDDVHNMLDTAIENNNRRAAIIERSEEYRKGKLTELEGGSYSERDRQLAQQALSMMQTALQDGDGQADLTRIKNVISKIKDRELRKDLNDNITGMINGAKKNIAKPQSKFGKIILFGFGLIKKFLSPVFKGAKLLLTGIWKSIKGVLKFGPKILKWLARPYLKGAAKVGAGVKGLAQGLFGWKETGADGTTEKRWGLLTPLFHPFKAMGNIVKWVTDNTGKFGEKLKSLGNRIKDFGISIKTKLQDIGGWLKDRMKDLKGKLKEFGEYAKTKFSSLFGGISGWFKERFGNKDRKPLTQFGKGLKAGWRSVKDSAKEKAAKFDPKSKDNTPATMTDQNTTTIASLVGNIVSILRGEDPEANKNKEEEEAKKKQEEETEAAEEEKASKAEGENTTSTQNGEYPPTLSEINQQSGQSGQSSESSTPATGSTKSESTETTSTGTSSQSSSSSKPEMESISTPGPSEESSSSEGSSKVEPSGESKSEGTTETGNRKSPLFKIGNLVGKIFGGITSIYGGLFKIVATAAMQLSAFKTLTKLVKEVITTAIKPLNKFFKTLVKEIKPILKTITSALTELVNSAVEVLSVLLESIGPFLEPLFNVVTDIMSGVGQMLVEQIGNIVSLLTPAVNFLLKVLVPIIKGIHAAIETVTGAIQVVIGKVLYGIGYLIHGAKSFFGGSSEDSHAGAGIKLMRTGNDLVQSGSDKFYTGIARGIDAVATAFHGDTTIYNYDNSTTNTDNSTTTTNEYNENADTVDNASKTQSTVIAKDDPAANKEVLESGKYADAANQTRAQIFENYGEEAIKDIYGSGDSQASYGTFMNMKTRGCGPIALAENINRRNFGSVFGSGDIDPRTLTSSMYSAGLYNPDRGTSVADYISAANSLGYGMQVGGVNYRSLKQASPTNPITLVGSGAGFGTGIGNTHYINVVGSDNGGYAYVSNPLTGRISKASMSQLALNSKLGIYGSGDELDEFEQKTVDDALNPGRNGRTDAQKLESALTVAGTTYAGAKIGTLIGGPAGTVIGGVVGFGGGLIADAIYNLVKSEPTADDKRAALERAIAKGNYTPEQVADMRAVLEQQLSGEKGQMVARVETDEDTQDPVNGLSDVSNIDFSSENIAAKYGPSTTISTLIGGLKDLASNFLSIFNNDEDTSTPEGQKKYLKRLKKEMGVVKYNILRAYAFLQFYKEWPPTGLESLEPGSSSAKIYAARFGLHEYEYITKNKDKVESSWNNLAPLFPINEIMILAAEIGHKNFAALFGVQSSTEVSRLDNLTIPELAAGICAVIDGLSGDAATAAINKAASSSGVNSSSAEWNSTTFTQADGLRYRALNYTPRTTLPEDGTYYHTTAENLGGFGAYGDKGVRLKNRNYLANCSGYAMGRIHEEVHSTDKGGRYFKTGSKNGGQFINRAKDAGWIVDEEGNYPRPGDIISWKDTKGTGNYGGCGHVAVIEEVTDPNTIIIGHSSASGFNTLYTKSSASGTSKGGTATGDQVYFQRTEIKRGNANNMWPLWPSRYKFLGLAHNPDIDYELANNGTNAFQNEDRKIAYTDKMKQYMDNNGDQFAYNWTYNDTNANLFDKSNYHQSAVEAGFTPAEEAYVAGIGIMENGAGKLIGKKSITLVGHDVKGSNDTGTTVNDFGVANWASKLSPGSNDYTYGRTLAEQLRRGFKENYFGPNPTGDRASHAKILKSNWIGHYNNNHVWINGYKDVLPRVIDRQLVLTEGDNWGNYLNKDLVEAGGHGVANACHGAGWNTERGHARYIGSMIGYWNYMADRGYLSNAALQERQDKASAMTGDPRYAAPTAANIKQDGSNLILIDKDGDRLASVLDLGKYSKDDPNLSLAYNQASKTHKGLKRLSDKWQTSGHNYYMYDAIGSITGAGDTSSSLYIPPIENKNILTDALRNTDAAKQTNNYYIAKDSSDTRREELNTLLNHTFNVRSESMEAILTEMLIELKKRENTRTPVSVPSPTTTPSLFDDQIPESIVRLMNG